MYLESFPTGPIQANCILLGNVKTSELAIIDPHVVQLVEAFVVGRKLQPSRGAQHSFLGNQCSAVSPGIAIQTLAHLGLEVEADCLEPSRARWLKVASAIRTSRVRVVDNERGLPFQTRLQEQGFSASRPEHVQADPNVRVGVPIPKEGRLSRALYPDQYDCFHGATEVEQTRFLAVRSTPAE